MPYAKKTWNKGDEITIRELNRIENGVVNVTNAVGELEEGSLSAVEATRGYSPIANGDGTWNWDTLQNHKIISPIYLGDFISPVALGCGCSILLGDYFYAVLCGQKAALLANNTNEGLIRKFDPRSDYNCEITTAAHTANVGHANSMAYDGETVYVAPVWDYTQRSSSNNNEPAHALYLYTFDSTMTPKGDTGKEAIPSTVPAMGVSYDPVQNKLYYYDYYHKVYEKIDGTWTLVTTIDFEDVVANEFSTKHQFEQDFAVYDGRFYISTPQCLIVSGKLEPETSYITSSYLVSATDVNNRFMMGELEGMEFDSKGHLYATMLTGISSELIDSFVVEIPVGEHVPNETLSFSADFFDGTLTLSEASQTMFALPPFRIRTISQLEVRTMRYNTSAILIPADNHVIDNYAHKINDRIKLALEGKLTVKEFYVYTGDLNISTIADPGDEANLIFTASETPIRLERAGNVAITGQYATRISKPNHASPYLIYVAYDYLRTTIREKPVSHEGYNFCFAGGSALNAFTTYIGTTDLATQGQVAAKLAKKSIQTGTKDFSLSSGTNNSELSVVFDEAFSAAPNVVLTLNSISAAYSDIAQCSCWVKSVSTTGFTCVVYGNNLSNTRTGTVSWIAIYNPLT